MDQETFNNLKPGDRIRLKRTGNTYTVEKAGTWRGLPSYNVRRDGLNFPSEAWTPSEWDLVPPPDPHTVPVRVAARLWHATPEEAKAITELLDDMDALTRADALERKGLPNLAEGVRRRVLGPPDPDWPKTPKGWCRCFAPEMKSFLNPIREDLEKLARTLSERLSGVTREMAKLRKERDRLAEDCKRAEEVRNDGVSRLAAVIEQRNDFADACDKMRKELTTLHATNVIFDMTNDRLEKDLAEQARLTDEARTAAEEMRARLADAAEHTFAWEDEQEDDD